MKKTNSKGFSLIELMVVISIIGILSIIAITALNSARDRSRTSAALSTASGIVPAISSCVESARDNNEGIQGPVNVDTGGGDICMDNTVEAAQWPELPTRYQYGPVAPPTNPDDWVFTVISIGDDNKVRVACDQGGCKDCKEQDSGACKDGGYYDIWNP